MENTLENKAAFFAQYWGVNILRFSPDQNYLRKVSAMTIRCPEDFVAILTPLSQISDEDGKMCVQVRSSTHIYVEITSRSNDGFGFTSRYNTSNRRRLHGYSLGFGEKMTIEQIDYLRSKGYALPWNGITVEEQIKRGWIKLKDNE